MYKNSYDKLNIAKSFNTNLENINSDGNLKIPNGANNFISEVQNNQTLLTEKNPEYQEVNLIRERQTRLTTNNLIFGSSFIFNYNSQQNILDESFFQLQWKLNLVGTLLNEIIKSTNTPKNDNDQFEIAGVTPSQYFKTELNYIKHWQLSRRTVLHLGLLVELQSHLATPIASLLPDPIFQVDRTITGVGEPTNWDLEAVVTSMNLMKLISNLHLIWSIDSP